MEKRMSWICGILSGDPQLLCSRIPEVRCCNAMYLRTGCAAEAWDP